MSYDVPTKVKSISTEIRVIRADGTVHNLGTVDMYDRNPFKRLWWSLFGKRLADKRITEANRYLETPVV